MPAPVLKKVIKMPPKPAWIVIACLLFSSGVVLAGGAEPSKVLDESSVHAIRWPVDESTTPVMQIVQDTSQVLIFDRRITRAAISNPEICDLTTLSPNEVLLVSKKIGQANLFVWDATNQIAAFRIQSSLNIDRMNEVLANVDPAAKLKIVPFNDTAAVYGETDTSVKLKQISDAAKAFQDKSVSFVSLRESKQILLEVRFAEVDRKAAKVFKFDVETMYSHHLLSLFPGDTGGSTKKADTPTYFVPTEAVIGPELNAVGNESVADIWYTYFSKSIGIVTYLQWLEQKNVVKTLARPNIVAKDGEEAQFTVGGEFPIPFETRDGISIQYKEYGTQLKFKPEILDKGLIRLKIDTIISELDYTNVVTLGGTTVPSLTKRTHQTVAELKDNQTLLVGGLITQKVDRVNKKTPVLCDLPFVGNLFKSSDYSRTDVELLMVVTPHIVNPMDLEERKTFYDKNRVREALRVYSPPYKDNQGDATFSLIVQDEKPRDLEAEEKAKEFAESVASGMRKQKPASLSYEESDLLEPLLNHPATSKSSSLGAKEALS